MLSWMILPSASVSRSESLSTNVMNQQMLKNIYEALGSLSFIYKGRVMFVSKNEETGEYKLFNKY